MELDISKLSPEQLEEIESRIAQQKKNEKIKREQERKSYESERDMFVKTMFNKAIDIHEILKDFKKELEKGLEEHAVKLANYGELRSNSKGGFKLADKENIISLVRTRDTEPTWDERSSKGVELIKNFLLDTVKKRDKDLFEILMSFLERNQKGDLETSRVMDLLQHQDKFEDNRWIEGLRLLRESYSNVLKGYGYLFKQRGSDGKWQTVTLNFSSI
jgi:hypothetical protein